MRDFKTEKLLRKAERYEEDGRFRQALKVYQELEELDIPEICFTILDGKGICYQKLGEFKLARESYRRGFKESKTAEDKSWFWRRRVYVIGKDLFQRNELSRAARILKAASEKEPSFPAFPWYLSTIYFYQKEYELNLKVLDRFIELEKDPKTRATAFLRKGVTFEVKGEQGKAEEAYLESIRLNPNNPMPYLHLGYIYLERKKEEKAFEAWKEAEELGVKSSPLLYNLTNFSLYQKDWDKGREYLRKIIEIDSSQVKEIIEVAPSKEAYQIILEEVFQRRDPKLEEDFLKVLEDGEINIDWVYDILVEKILVEKKASQIDFLSRKARKGKKVRLRYHILELAERGLSKIEEKRIEMEKAREALAVQIEPDEYEELEEAMLRKEREKKKKRKFQRTISYDEEY